MNPKADMDQHGRDVRFVPKADITQCSRDWRYSITSAAASFFSIPPRGGTGARPAHLEYSAKPQEEEGVSAVIAKSNVLPIANFTDGIFKQASAIATGWLSRP